MFNSTRGEAQFTRVADVGAGDQKDPITRFLDDLIKRDTQPKAEPPQVKVEPPQKPAVPLPPDRPLDLSPPVARRQDDHKPASKPGSEKPQARNLETPPAQKPGAPYEDKLTAKGEKHPDKAAKPADIAKPKVSVGKSEIEAPIIARATAETSRFAKYPTEKLSPVLQSAQVMTREFLAEADKKAALPKYEIRAREIMQNSDKTFFDAEKTQNPLIRKAEQNYITKNSLLSASVDELHTYMHKLPQEVQDKTNKLLTIIDNNGDNPVTQAKIKAQLKDYPELIEKIGDAVGSQKALTDAATELQKARDPLVKAAREEAQSRFLFQRMAQLAGNKQKAEDFGVEGELLQDKYFSIANKKAPEEILDVRKI